ncbi:MAG: class I SAM-dependent methyltransferase [Coxiellaceae bacterium]|nr:class I SAM-dependent methyltransferase [Coxiellaceae bacterium]
MQTCSACTSQNLVKINPGTYFFPSDSFDKKFHTYNNIYCEGCGIISIDRLPDKTKLIEYYNNNYRKSDFAITITQNKTIDLPIQIPWSGFSYSRFQNFLNLVKDSKDILPISKESKFLDYGGYQGFFLYAVKQTFGCNVFNYEYNKHGLDFAEKALGISGQQGKDIQTDTFDTKFDFISLNHVFEHLDNPVQFLTHVRTKVLNQNGCLYIEVPNAFGSPLSDPTHFNMYTATSLINILSLAGYKTINHHIHGNQVYGLISDNNYRNISIIATPEKSPTFKVIHTPVLARRFCKDLRRSYLKVYLNYIRHSIGLIFSELKRLIGVFGFLILEKFLCINPNFLKSTFRKNS